MRKGLSKNTIAKILGAAPKHTIAELEQKFPPRNLPSGAIVSRFAPSPTGYMHIGGMYQALLDWKLAQQSGGVFMLRIEDTDTKREVKDAVRIIENAMAVFDASPDESEKSGGHYGPYYQSMRRDIYHSVAAELLASGHAYPCFLSAEEMDAIREKQKSAGFPTGIYGEWARDRDLSQEEIISHLESGKIPSVRLYSTGDRTQKIFCRDASRGSIAFPQNDEDIVLVKSNDGLPTYHFAHLVDDHFMRTTHVVRGEEWLSSFPLHVQMFNMMGWGLPEYIHTSTIDKIDDETGKQRKLSKRKDPEANIETFLVDGWPVVAVLNYLFNIMAPGFEEAKAKQPELKIRDYELKIKKIPTSGALFDWKKLEWWAREFIATLSSDELTGRIIDWARVYSPEWTTQIVTPGGADYLRAMLSIERDNPKRIRKDFITWRQTLEEVAYFWDDLFKVTPPVTCGDSPPASGVVSTERDLESIKVTPPASGVAQNSVRIDKNILVEFLATFDISDDKDAWWNKIKTIAQSNNVKPGDVAMALRVALTGRTNTPDLFSIMQVMGSERVKKRVESAV